MDVNMDGNQTIRQFGEKVMKNEEAIARDRFRKDNPKAYDPVILNTLDNQRPSLMNRLDLAFSAGVKAGKKIAQKDPLNIPRKKNLFTIEIDWDKEIVTYWDADHRQI